MPDWFRAGVEMALLAPTAINQQRFEIILNEDETVSFKDKGVQFNPLAKEDPDTTLAAEDRDIGGLGIYLTKQFMDNVTYTYSEGYNLLTIQKRIS